MRTVLLAASIATFGFTTPAFAKPFAVPMNTIAQFVGSSEILDLNDLVSDVTIEDEPCTSNCEHSLGQMGELVEKLISTDLQLVGEVGLELDLSLCFLGTPCRCEDDCALEPVPEPGTLALLATGVGTAVVRIRRKKNK
jgi:hypothetical protein